jgi:transmembrane sensor
MVARRRPVVDDVFNVAREYSTGIGQRDSIVLVDGTRVLLGPASWILSSGRKVQLHGEAYFDVVHDAREPFVVVTGDAIIRDIGTKFSVHSDSAQAVRVVVSEGAVRIVAGLRDSVNLSAGDVGVVEPPPGGRVQASRGAATEDDLAWTRGRLVFRDASMAEVAADLRRWYGVQLRVSDTALLRRHFTGSFANESPDRVLSVIALALNARVDRRGDTAFIRLAPPSSR